MAENSVVSDHVVLRYMERVLGFDFGRIRSRILTHNVQMAIDVGANRIPCDDDKAYVLVIKSGRIITVMERDKRKTGGTK